MLSMSNGPIVQQARPNNGKTDLFFLAILLNLLFRSLFCITTFSWSLSTFLVIVDVLLVIVDVLLVMVDIHLVIVDIHLVIVDIHLVIVDTHWDL